MMDTLTPRLTLVLGIIATLEQLVKVAAPLGSLRFFGLGSLGVSPGGWARGSLEIPQSRFLGCWSWWLPPWVLLDSSASVPRVLVLVASPPGFFEVLRIQFLGCWCPPQIP